VHGKAWLWGQMGEGVGDGEYGQLGLKDVHNRLVQTLLAGELLGSTTVVLVAAGE